MASRQLSGRGVQRAAGGATRSTRARIAEWLDEALEDDEIVQEETRPAKTRAAAEPRHSSLDDLTMRLEELAERMAPPVEEEDEPEEEEEHRDDASVDRMILALARRTKDSEDRIASALELLTRVIERQDKPAPAAPARAHHAAPEARDFPPPPPPPPSRDDRASDIEERMARLGWKAAASPEPRSIPQPAIQTGAARPSFTFVPFTSTSTATPEPKAQVGQPRLKDVVSEITARQRMLVADARKDDLNRVRILETKIAEIAAKVDATARPAPQTAYLTQEMSALNDAVQSLAQRVTVPLAADGSPQMLNSIYRALEDLSHRFDRQGASSLSADTLEQLRDGVDALTQRLDTARPGEETRSVLNTIQRSIEHLAVRLDQAVQAPSTSEALKAMRAAIDGLGERVTKIGGLAERTDNLCSLENTIEGLIKELRSAGAKPAPVPAATNAALTSVERAITDLSQQLERRSPGADDRVALTSIHSAIEDLADRLERNTSGNNLGEANAAIQQALEALATRIDISDRRLQKIASLEDTVGHLARLFEEHHNASTEVTQAVAARAVREALAGLPLGGDEERLSSLSQTVTALQSQSEKAERRTIDAFESVRSTLERIVDRLADAPQEPAGAKPILLDPMMAARAAAQRALAEAEAMEAVRPDTGEARSKRARFIAAARRATTPSLPASFSEDADTDLLAVPGRKNWQNRRTLMVGVAGVLLVLGSFQFGKMALDARDTDTPDGQLASAPATVPAAGDRLRETPLDVTPKATAQAASGQTAAEPVVTGSIPAALDIPDSIGGRVLVDSARKGDPAAIHEVAVRTFDGDRTERDLAKAVKLFEKAGEMGYAPAQYRAGNAYDKGHGVTASPAVAEGWYRKAAEQGHIKAMHNLAVLLAEGGLGKPDYPQAGYWFRRAADRGVRDSQYNLGVMLARGLGLNQDMADAYKWFAVAASAGDTDSAAKRDQVAAKLKPATLVAARLEAQTWQPLPKDAMANDESAPAGGWDSPQS